MHEPRFLFATCQPGAERALKAEVARDLPELRPAFSRPGFVTFKRLQGNEESGVALVFARTAGESLGKLTGESDLDRAAAARERTQSQAFDRIHIWPRTERMPIDFTTGVAAIATAFKLPAPELNEGAIAAELVVAAHKESRMVLDCVLVEPNEWWLGSHELGTPPTYWPGGIYQGILPAHAVSRAYLKMDEAITWSLMGMRAGDEVAEIGCSPGGASQALLDRGLTVLGIDPALVDERVTAHPNFKHLRKRGHEVRRREFRKTRWLTADMNVAPQYTLDTVEAIVTHPEINIRGLLLTLKLLDWSLAAEIPSYLARIRSWGYADVRARQLSHNRQEICVAAKVASPPR